MVKLHRIVENKIIKEGVDVWHSSLLIKLLSEIEGMTNTYALTLNHTKPKTIYYNSDTNVRSPKGNQSSAESGNTTYIEYNGTYLDHSSKPHLIQILFTRDESSEYSFTIWIRPDLKGTSSTKREKQKDLSFIKDWLRDNVLTRKEMEKG